MSACADRQLALSAYLDAELEPAAAEELELHLAACGDCRADLAALEAVSDAIRRAGPLAPVAAGQQREQGVPGAGPSAIASTAQVAAAPRREPGASGAAPGAVAPVVPIAARKRLTAPTALRGLAAAAVVVLAVAVGYGAGRRGGDTAARAALTADLLSAHLRGLLPGRLVDVASSDRHQVKPWFAGRLDFSPPVPDLAASGFPLLGGRLDFVSGQRAAVLVYGRRLHRIDVFVFPLAPGTALPHPDASRLGYNFITWRQGPLAFVAVSDVAPADLRLLASLIAAAP